MACETICRRAFVLTANVAQQAIRPGVRACQREVRIVVVEPVVPIARTVAQRAVVRVVILHVIFGFVIIFLMA